MLLVLAAACHTPDADVTGLAIADDAGAETAGLVAVDVQSADSEADLNSPPDATMPDSQPQSDAGAPFDGLLFDAVAPDVPPLNDVDAGLQADAPPEPDAVPVEPLVTATQAGWTLLADTTLPAGDWQALTARPGGQVAVWKANQALQLNATATASALDFVLPTDANGSVLVAGRNFEDCALLGGRKVVLIGAQFQIAAQIDLPAGVTASMPAPRGDGTCAVGWVSMTEFGVLVLAKNAPPLWQSWPQAYQGGGPLVPQAHPLQGWFLLGGGAALWQPGQTTLSWNQPGGGYFEGIDGVRGGADGMVAVYAAQTMFGAGSSLLQLRSWPALLPPVGEFSSLPDSFSPQTIYGKCYGASRSDSTVRADGVGHRFGALTVSVKHGSCMSDPNQTTTVTLNWLDPDANLAASFPLCSDAEKVTQTTIATSLTLAPGLTTCAVMDWVENRPSEIVLLPEDPTSPMHLLWLQPVTPEPAKNWGPPACAADSDCPPGDPCTVGKCDPVAHVCLVAAAPDGSACKGGKSCSAGTCSQGTCSAGRACAGIAANETALKCGDSIALSAATTTSAAFDHYPCTQGVFAGGERTFSFTGSGTGSATVQLASGATWVVVETVATTDGALTPALCLQAGKTVSFVTSSGQTRHFLVDSRSPGSDTLTVICGPIACGDGACTSTAETCTGCSQDCGACSPWEGISFCPVTPACGSCDKCVEGGAATCNNAICEPLEADGLCIADCPSLTLGP